MKKEGKGILLRNFIWIVSGIILMAIMVTAVTTITDNSIITTGDGEFQNINVSSNLTIQSYLFLDNDYSLPPGQNKILRRNTASKAVFGVQNENLEVSTDSGAGYVLNTTIAEYRLDLHSAADINNPNQTVHHLIGANSDEIWRLNAVDPSSFRFEQGLNDQIFTINRTGTFLPKLAGNGNCQLNITNTGQLILGVCS